MLSTTPAAREQIGVPPERPPCAHARSERTESVRWAATASRYRCAPVARVALVAPLAWRVATSFPRPACSVFVSVIFTPSLPSSISRCACRTPRPSPCPAPSSRSAITSVSDRRDGHPLRSSTSKTVFTPSLSASRRRGMLRPSRFGRLAASGPCAAAARSPRSRPRRAPLRAAAARSGRGSRRPTLYVLSRTDTSGLYANADSCQQPRLLAIG